MAQTVTVEGMACDGCEENVEESVGDIDGVADVTANHEDGVVEVDGDFDIGAVERAVREAGYEVA
ncbi:MAG: heavy-metal-associated domain-containing protein [Halobacteria archaeon]|nr:heavy-metal-associated domain-containing protein [Halobacteria archaeon]